MEFAALEGPFGRKHCQTFAVVVVVVVVVVVAAVAAFVALREC